MAFAGPVVLWRQFKRDKLGVNATSDSNKRQFVPGADFFAMNVFSNCMGNAAAGPEWGDMVKCCEESPHKINNVTLHSFTVTAICVAGQEPTYASNFPRGIQPTFSHTAGDRAILCTVHLLGACVTGNNRGHQVSVCLEGTTPAQLAKQMAGKEAALSRGRGPPAPIAMSASGKEEAGADDSDNGDGGNGGGPTYEVAPEPSSANIATAAPLAAPGRERIMHGIAERLRERLGWNKPVCARVFLDSEEDTVAPVRPLYQRPGIPDVNLAYLLDVQSSIPCSDTGPPVHTFSSPLILPTSPVARLVVLHDLVPRSSVVASYISFGPTASAPKDIAISINADMVEAVSDVIHEQVFDPLIYLTDDGVSLRVDWPAEGRSTGPPPAASLRLKVTYLLVKNRTSTRSRRSIERD